MLYASVMMDLKNTWKGLTLVLVAFLGTTQHVVNAHDGNRPLGRRISAAMENISNYAFSAQTISYTKKSDFSENLPLIKTIELKPGQSLKYRCGGTSESKRDGTFVMVPNDPSKHVLEYIGENGMAVALKRLRPSYFVYRSTDPIIVTTFLRLGMDHLLVSYNKDTVVAAMEPEKFSLNFVCIFRPHSDSSQYRYRWLQVKLTDVTHLPYGCGNTMSHMFRNAIPVDVRNPLDRGKPLRRCPLYVKPGMVVGIYCGKGETIQPPNCFAETYWAKPHNYEHNGFLTTSFPHNSNNDKFRLAVVTEASMQVHGSAVCHCVNKKDEPTVTVKLHFRPEQICDLVKFMDDFYKSRGHAKYQCHKELRPGSHVRFIVPNSKVIGTGNNTLIIEGIYPTYPETETIIGTKEDVPILHGIEFVVAKTGLEIESRKEADHTVIDYYVKKDAVIILKENVSNLIYYFGYKHYFNGKEEIRNTTLALAILPTDPYTYGCGLPDYDHYFRYRDAEDFYSRDQLLPGEESTFECTIKVYQHTPVGFYCPVGYTTTPPDCFEHAIRESTGEIVPVSNYAPMARLVSSRNIRVMDFNVSKKMSHLIRYSREILKCTCTNSSGKELAVIRMDFSKPGQGGQ